jgi:hypothetical protein
MFFIAAAVSPAAAFAPWSDACPAVLLARAADPEGGLWRESFRPLLRSNMAAFSLKDGEC